MSAYVSEASEHMHYRFLKSDMAMTEKSIAMITRKSVA
jgi:hypothetical protein